MRAAEKICFVPGGREAVSHLRGVGSLVQRRGVSIFREQEGLTCECLDLFTNDVNAPVVTGVELENHLPHVFVAIYSSC